MRKIALIMDGWKRFCTYAWPAGILQFDGIILELNNISSQKTLQDVVQRAKDAQVPVLSIANELEDFYYVGIDNYQAMEDVIAHLHQKHNCKKFWCIMGPEDNYENALRTNALKDYMKEWDIPYSEEDFYHGDFDYRSGVQSFKKLMDTHDGKPDAIVCANDNIAVAVCETAKEYGYRVPEDFCVTGFDNFDKASYYVPSITTVGHIREEAGYLCADILLRLWNGISEPILEIRLCMA